MYVFLYTLTLVEQHFISLHFLAGSLPAFVAEQPKVSSCCLASLGQGWRIGGCDSWGEAHAGALTHCSGAASDAAASASSAIPACFISITAFKGMEIKLYLGHKHILSRNTYYI